LLNRKGQGYTAVVMFLSFVFITIIFGMMMPLVHWLEGARSPAEQATNKVMNDVRRACNVGITEQDEFILEGESTRDSPDGPLHSATSHDDCESENGKPRLCYGDIFVEGEHNCQIQIPNRCVENLDTGQGYKVVRVAGDGDEGVVKIECQTGN